MISGDIRAPKNDFIVTHILISDRNIFFKDKYAAISFRSGAHVGERNLFLSVIRRSYRRSKLACLTASAKIRLLLKVCVLIAPRTLATSGRRPGVRAKRAACGVAGRQL